VCSHAGVTPLGVNRTLGLCSAVLVLLLLGLASRAVASADETVMVCDIYGDHIAAPPAQAYGIRATERCPGDASRTRYSRTHPPGGLAIWTVPGRAPRTGEVVRWVLRPPSGLIISSVNVPHMYSYGINNRSGWTGGLFWYGGSGGARTFDGQSGWSSANSHRPRFVWPSGGTRYFGWRLACRRRRCRRAGDQWLSLELLEVRARETQAPHLIAPDGLWQAHGWIRGWWTLHFYGDSPAGLCATESSLADQPGPGAVSTRDPAVWHQCDAQPVDQPVDTSEYGQGVLPLTLRAIDAAGQSVSYTRTIAVDNQPPTVSLSGPRDASSDSGTQYVTATATAGPSGVAGIACSVDGAPTHWYPAASASVPVSGMGIHHLVCYSQNNARDSAGSAATSAPATWLLSIRSPSVSTVSFVRIVNALRCLARREWVWILGHWVTAYHHGHRVRLRIPAHGSRLRVVDCRPRVLHRRVSLHGRWVAKRVVLLPHRVDVSRLRVRFGQRATVAGWLGTPSGRVLAGQRVNILVASDNGTGHYRRAAVVSTNADGVWRARLPPGPSRSVVAVYGGGPTAEPSVSSPAQLVVQGKIDLRLSPRRVRWGATIQIRGRVRGGYIPRYGEVVFIWVRWRRGSTEIGSLYTTQDGRFRATYTFHRGRGTEHYRLWASTGRESDYPYAPGRSNSVRVTVSP
jgi:hypothetical protein